MSAQRLALAGLSNVKCKGIITPSLQKDSEIGVSNGAVKSCLAHNVVCSFFASSAPFLAARTKGDLPHRRCSIGTPTSFPGCPLIGVREGSNKTVTGALQMSPSLDASARQSVSVSADFLPASFTVLADTFLAYLRDPEVVASDEEVFIDKRVFGLCVAGGINDRNEAQMIRAKNYIFAALGLELSEPEVFEPVPRGQDRIIVTDERSGHVYVLSNPSLPGLVKIGYTCTTVAERVRQLSGSTSIPTPFAVIDSFPTDKPIVHEARIHALLASRRMPGREFFSVTEAEAVTACKNIIGAA